MHTQPMALAVQRTPGLTGSDNMQRDRDALAQCAVDGVTRLRFYTWARPTISLGWMQDADTLLDLDACQRDGIDVVLRPTGGRAILHDEECTYALVGSTRRAPFDAGLRDTHRVIAECLQLGLSRLGIDATLSRPSADPTRQLLRQPCFVSAGRAELIVHGRKLLGSAQRRTRDAFLQHGSLLVGAGHLRLVDYLRPAGPQPDTAGERQALRRRLQRNTVHLQELLPQLPSFDVLCDALTWGFEQRLRDA